MNAFRFFLSLLGIVAVLALLVPATGFSQVRTSGSVMAGLGLYSDDSSGTTVSDILGESQAQVDFTGELGPVSYKYRLRVRETSNALAATRHQVTWKVSDNFTLDFIGQYFGLPASNVAGDVYSIGHFGDGIIIGDMSASGDFSDNFLNTTGLNATFSTGSISVGLLILDACVPDPGCVSEDQSLVPHFIGEFGAVTVGAFYSATSGKDGTSSSVDSSEGNIEVAFNTNGFAVGAEYTMYSDNADNEGTGMAVGVQTAGIGAHYVAVTLETGAGTTIVEKNEISVSYTYAVNDSSELVPAYAVESDTLADTSQTLLIVSAKTSF